jgi:hypothetical protein
VGADADGNGSDEGRAAPALEVGGLRLHPAAHAQRQGIGRAERLA